jgi:hypothetical protein
MSCGRLYAFKHLNSDLRDRGDLRRQFVDEGKLLGRLHGHPNIVDVIMQGVTADELELPFIVMELLNGPNIRRILAKQKRLEPTIACLMMVDVLAALEHAHERGVAHRDVKPENVVSHRDAEGRPKITVVDFGIYRERSGSNRHRVAGTPLYMAPELFDEKSQAPPHLGDIYAAGVMLYELLTGATPFDNERSDEAIRKAHQRRTPEPPSKRVAGLSAQLEDAIMRALEKDPTKRWQDAFQFMHALRLCVQGHVHGQLNLDVHTRVTAEQIPTHVATPVDESAEDRTDPGPPPAEAMDGTDRRNPPVLPTTEPGIPWEILQGQIAKAAGRHRGTQPGTPQAQQAALPVLSSRVEPKVATAGTLPMANGGASEALDSQRLSRVATRTPPGAEMPPSDAGAARSGTPVVELPPVREDPAAPERFREAAALACKADEPDRVWLDEEAARDTLAKVPKRAASTSDRWSLLNEHRDVRGKSPADGPARIPRARGKRLQRLVAVGIPAAVFLLTIGLGLVLLRPYWLRRGEHATSPVSSAPVASASDHPEAEKAVPALSSAPTPTATTTPSEPATIPASTSAEDSPLASATVALPFLPPRPEASGPPLRAQTQPVASGAFSQAGRGRPAPPPKPKARQHGAGDFMSDTP